MPLELELRDASPIPIEVEGITPDVVAELSLPAIERRKIFHGNRQLALADLFNVRGDASDRRIVFSGDTGGIHRIGAGMQGGVIEVRGNAGGHVGGGMGGGEINVAGNVGHWAGAEMLGGLIRVQGDAGNRLGASYVGSPRGMTGGTILVHGNAGDEVGHSMRRGLVAVGGNVGDFAALDMLAGSVVVGGRCGARPAAGMRRGTLAVLGQRPELLPTFRSGGLCEPLFLQVYLRAITRLGLSLAAELAGATYELFHGDLVTVGRGEILIRE